MLITWLCCLNKLGWRLLTKPDSLAAQLFKAIYHPHCSFLDADMGERPSYSWRSIMEARPVLQTRLIWRIGDGRSINIWQADWIPGFPPHTLEKPDNTIFELVSDLMDESTHSWNVHAVYACFPSHIAELVLSIPLSRRVRGDLPAWKFDKRGFFSVKSAYQVARDLYFGHYNASTSQGDPYIAVWRALWRAKVPNKVAIFSWRAAHNLLPVRAALNNKGYDGDLTCVVCHQSMETLEHLFCNCSVARDIFSQPPFNVSSTPLTWKDWLLARATSMQPDMFAKLLVTLWNLWKNRNNALWRNQRQNSIQLVSSAMAWYEDYTKFNSSSPKEEPVRSNRRQVWSTPDTGTLKLNVDGSFVAPGVYGGAGGVLRDDQGQFIAGFAHRLDFIFSALHAELLAMRYGLDLLHTMGISKAIIESDYLAAVQVVNSPVYDLSPLGSLISDIRTSLANHGEICISFAPRQTNMVAHKLAGYGYDVNIHYEWLTHAPDLILDALMYDWNRMQ